MRATLSSRLGEDSLGQQALSLVAGSLAATTVGTYGSAFQRFLSFCSQQGLDPFQTQEADVVRYLAWLGQEGTVAAASLQPYLSAINRFLGDHGKEPVALGPLVARARQGLKLQQLDSAPAPVRVPLPAETVTAILEHLWGQRHLFSPAKVSQHAPALRAQLAVVMGFIFPGRGSTSTALKAGEVLVDSTHITVLHLKVKGKDGEPDHTKPLLRVPVTAQPQLAALLHLWQQLQASWWPKGRPHRRFWLLPSDPPTSWTAATLSAWLALACQTVAHQPPPGLKWTSHSLRKGAATCMNAIGVPLPTIRYWGGWARDSSVVHDYIDPTVRPSPAAFQLFGWLIGRVTYQPEPVVVPGSQHF